jgi:hypothetical protein
MDPKMKQDLIDEANRIQNELDNLYVKPQFLIDDDDEYQDALEISYYKRELQDRLYEIYAELEGES